MWSLNLGVGQGVDSHAPFKQSVVYEKLDGVSDIAGPYALGT
jgi:hypothetical protein